MKKKTTPAKAATRSVKQAPPRHPHASRVTFLSRTFRCGLRRGLMSSTYNEAVWMDIIYMTGWTRSKKSWGKLRALTRLPRAFRTENRARPRHAAERGASLAITSSVPADRPSLK